jgi:hypothetical protein
MYEDIKTRTDLPGKYKEGMLDSLDHAISELGLLKKKKGDK